MSEGAYSLNNKLLYAIIQQHVFFLLIQLTDKC